MKAFVLLMIICCFLLAANSFSQQKKYIAPEFESINKTDLLFKYGNKTIPYAQIKASNIGQLFGPAIKIQKGKSGGVPYTNYTYSFGYIAVEEGTIESIAVKNTGLTFVLKNKGRLINLLSVGADARYLKQFFPKSWKSIRGNFFTLPLKNEDASVIIELKNTIVVGLYYTTNDND